MWLENMNLVAGFYEGKVKEFAERFLKSPAGQSFQDGVQKSRNGHHTTLPDVPPIGEMGWNPCDIFKFYNLLGDIADNIEPCPEFVFLMLCYVKFRGRLQLKIMNRMNGSQAIRKR